MKPHPKISAKHYAPAPPAAAKVRFRIKGQSDGPVYQGQKIVTPCASCRPPASPARVLPVVAEDLA
jgi:hypothetical protein